MPKAVLKSANLSHTAIDEATGVISGCKLMQVGKTATFKGADGKVRSFEVTPELIAGLVAHAGNRSIPCHLTHDSDSLSARLGLHKNLRVDAAGDLASDLHTSPNEYGRLALWTAKTDPASAAFSAVFAYNEIKDGTRTLAVPLDFQAADLVARGAACEAMLSKTQTDTDMTKEEITDLIRAELKGYKLPENLATKEDITSAVKAALSEFKPAVSDEDAKKIALLAKADAVAEIGKHTAFVQATGAVKQTDEFTAQLEVYRKTAPNEATAIARLLKDHPELNEAREQHVRATLSAFNS